MTDVKLCPLCKLVCHLKISFNICLNALNSANVVLRACEDIPRDFVAVAHEQIVVWARTHFGDSTRSDCNDLLNTNIVCEVVVKRKSALFVFAERIAHN